MEIWKDVAGYEGLYQVSNYGNVKSTPRASTKGGLLKPSHDRKGYVVFILCKNGSVKSMKAHRLVATAFIPNPLDLPEVNHKDEIKTNNCVDNLEWCSCKYNENYGTKSKRAKEAISIPVCQYDLLGRKMREFRSVTEAAIAVSDINAVSTISKCCKGKRKTAYGFIWGYK